MAHQIKVNLSDLNALASAVKDLTWYLSPSGGYKLTEITTEGGTATWTLETRPAAPLKTAAAAPPQERRHTVEPGDKVIVETKGQQMDRRLGGGDAEGVEGVVFRVLTRGPHPHGMKVELRDRTVGRVKRNLTVPGAGEPGTR